MREEQADKLIEVLSQIRDELNDINNRYQEYPVVNFGVKLDSIREAIERTA